MNDMRRNPEPSRRIFNLASHIGMVRGELAFDDAAGKWIAAQLNAMAVTGSVPLSPGSSHQLSALSN